MWKDIAGYWLEFIVIQVTYGLVILFGTGALFPLLIYLGGISLPWRGWALAFTPWAAVAFALRHGLGWQENPLRFLLNEKKGHPRTDSDWGAAWWLEREKLKPGLISAVRWWLRNPAWNYILTFENPSTADFLIIQQINTLTSGHSLAWANYTEPGYKGINLVHYLCNDGRVYGRFSFANNWLFFQAGASGYRHQLLLNVKF